MRTELWRFHQMTLKSGSVANRGDAAFIEQASGKVVPGLAAGAGYVFIGPFAENVDASASGPLGAVDQPVNVDFMHEKAILWRTNAGDVTSANIGSYGYFTDAQTVTAVAAGHTKAGLILAVDATYGVAVAVDSLTSEV